MKAKIENSKPAPRRWKEEPAMNNKHSDKYNLAY